MWNVHRRIDVRRLPAERVVVRFDFRAFPPRWGGLRTCWFVLQRAGVDVCLKDPGFDIDLVVSADAGRWPGCGRAT